MKTEPNQSLGIILGSAFHPDMLPSHSVTPFSVDTPWGAWMLHQVQGLERPAYLSFRHGYPHHLLPNQIPYRAQAAAFEAVHCGALLVTSSVGVLTPDLPLYTPLLATDILTLDNRLPDGTACSMFIEPTPNHGHLVLNEGLFSSELAEQLKAIGSTCGLVSDADVVFGYVGGPRTKTKAENRMWHSLGAHVNSMTLAPEVILANELGIATAGVVVGHKYSVPDIEAPPDHASVATSLVNSREALRKIVHLFIEQGRPVPFKNHLYHYQSQN